MRRMARVPHSKFRVVCEIQGGDFNVSRATAESASEAAIRSNHGLFFAQRGRILILYCCGIRIGGTHQWAQAHFLLVALFLCGRLVLTRWFYGS